MKSEADIIYSHINSEDIQRIEISTEDMIKTLKKAITQDNLKNIIDRDKRIYFEAIRLEPIFRSFIMSKEKETGIEARFWSNDYFEKVKDEFSKLIYKKEGMRI